MHYKIEKLKIRGFTLVEVLVVMSIISFFSSIFLSPLDGAREKAKNTAIQSSVEQWMIAIANYRNDYGAYFDSGINLICLGGTGFCKLGPGGSPMLFQDATFNSQMSVYLSGTPNPNPDYISGDTPFQHKSTYFGNSDNASVWWYLYGDVACGLGATKTTLGSGNTECYLESI